ncbi:MAG: Endonuclease III [Candidatus Magasanikbacteria bacterium GW2011_GWA2_45_39]|uniref:Endonuclease III n=2 Tax=Candidatus Magasanikiibacteriota TaxID=1752731 RepID=A0A0G1QZ81_9BACT|nr:MAG: Endonuclease III [Candidatus Magasanikbacteria bacterium GW2011_GWA2_45_39]KKU13995.1 MAG: Endonuclease III [Candidatus Magasanikbacteria bacterium GW2011_GWC2_45_8]
MPPQKLKELRARTAKIDRVLKKLFPHAQCALGFSTPWELMVAVQLSAQCTDKKVNEITPTLFKKYRRLDDYVRADTKEFQKDIHATGFFRNKTKNILAAAHMVKERYHGRVPHTMEDVLKLPGVARKTANVVLGNAYGVVEGIAVDTHVRRLARALGLTKEWNPNKIEKDLMQIIPTKEWFAITYRLIEYGRKYCPARGHNHHNCPLHRFYFAF